MGTSNRNRQALHFFGDLFFFVFSLWITLILRHFSLPSTETFMEYLFPFSLLFTLWIFVFYAAGLYEKQTLVLRKKLPITIFKSQIVNVIIGAFFFYLFPGFKLTPKTILFIYLLVSFAFILSWRLAINGISRSKKEKEILIIGEGPDIEELALELDENPTYGVKVKRSIKLDTKSVSVVIVDLRNEKTREMIPDLYNLMLSGTPVIDAEKLYEDIFERIPLSFLEEQWFLKNLSFYSRSVYDPIKRVIDVGFAFFMGALSLMIYPFIILAIKIDDRGPAFIIQDRIGQGGKIVKIVKFRSMRVSDKGIWVEKDDERITSVGKVLRKTRMDELPQLYNVLKGDISLVGPRPDIAALKNKLEKEIPYYNIRTVVRPGLSGWAQVSQDSPPQSVEETKKRLMYDLYYIKNRSLMLDIKISLRTLGILASRSGV